MPSFYCLPVSKMFLEDGTEVKGAFGFNAVLGPFGSHDAALATCREKKYRNTDGFIVFEGQFHTNPHLSRNHDAPRRNQGSYPWREDERRRVTPQRRRGEVTRPQGTKGKARRNK